MNSKLSTIFRILLALILLVFGLNKFIGFLQMPPMGDGATEFLGALDKTGYMFPIIGLVEIVAGLFLLLNKWTKFALVLLVPISINIILFHLTFNLEGIAPGALVFVLNFLLIYAYRKGYKSLF